MRKILVLENISVSGPDQETMHVHQTRLAAQGRFVGGRYFSILGGSPIQGRFLTTQDLGTRNVVLSFDTWKSLYHGADILEKFVAIGDSQYKLVGVAP